MGDIRAADRVLLILAAFSRHEAALDWALGRAMKPGGRRRWPARGSISRETDYYEPTMGAGIRKTFLGVRAAGRSGRLPRLKLETNRWEAEYAAEAGHAEPRPLNLDPGYLTAAKLVLASTKDHAHRVYLSRRHLRRGDLVL